MTSATNLDMLIETAWKSLLCAGFVLLALWLLRRRSAAERSLLAHLGLAAIVMLPLAAAALPRLDIEAPPAVATAYRQVAPIVAAEPMEARETAPAAAPVRAEDPGLDRQQLLLAAWAVPALALLLLTLVGMARLRRLRARSEVVVDPAWLTAMAAAQRRLGLKHGTALLVSSELKSPVSWGIMRPVILLDAKAAGEHERAEAIIAHELAHVARLDWLALLLGRLAIALFWFNPLVWLLARHGHDLSEQAADDVVLRSDVPGPDYAEVLVGAARHATRPLLLAANGVAPHRSSLARRVVAILDPKRNRVPVRMLWMLLSLAGTGAIATAVAAADPHLPGHSMMVSAVQGNNSMRAMTQPAAATPQASALGRQLVEEIRKGHSDEALALIEAGADVNVMVEGDGTPLIVAARKGNAALVRRLIEAGANVNGASPGDGNPLIAAADKGEMAVIEMLVRAGADVNAHVESDETPLINAARENRIEAARYLIEAGADVNLAVDSPTSAGIVRRSPLGMARRGHHKEMERLLRSRGARS